MIHSLSIISDGGPVFMIPLVLLMVVVIILLVVALSGKMSINKASKLIGHVSLFALVWGFLGSTLGLISAFDAIESVGGISEPMMASGLKIALLSTLFGLITFLIGRAVIIILTLKEKV